MTNQQIFDLPPPVVSGWQSPFHASYPIELQNIPKIPHGARTPVDEDDVRKAAWKYQGYKEFSKWMASDDDLFIFRRFQSLNARTILYMQDRIGQIEHRLNQIHDANEDAPLDTKRKNSSIRWDMRHEPERDRLMCELTGLLHHYNQYIRVFSDLRARSKAEPRQVENLRRFKGRKAIREDEMEFINHEHDLISINDHPTTPLGKMLEATKLVRLSGLMKAKSAPEAQSSSQYTHYSSDEALARLSTTTIVLLGLLMLLGPIWWLEFVNNSTIRLGIITGFLVFFVSLMSLATINRPFEVVASTAAYAAVLMVFMQGDAKN